jgi:hypothetical protein
LYELAQVLFVHTYNDARKNDHYNASCLGLLTALSTIPGFGGKLYGRNSDWLKRPEKPIAPMHNNPSFNIERHQLHCLFELLSVVIRESQSICANESVRENSIFNSRTSEQLKELPCFIGNSVLEDSIRMEFE